MQIVSIHEATCHFLSPRSQGVHPASSIRLFTIIPDFCMLFYLCIPLLHLKTIPSTSSEIFTLEHCRFILSSTNRPHESQDAITPPTFLQIPSLVLLISFHLWLSEPQSQALKQFSLVHYCIEGLWNHAFLKVSTLMSWCISPMHSKLSILACSHVCFSLCPPCLCIYSNIFHLFLFLVYCHQPWSLV